MNFLPRHPIWNSIVDSIVPRRLRFQITGKSSVIVAGWSLMTGTVVPIIFFIGATVRSLGGIRSPLLVETSAIGVVEHSAIVNATKADLGDTGLLEQILFSTPLGVRNIIFGTTTVAPNLRHTLIHGQWHWNRMIGGGRPTERWRNASLAHRRRRESVGVGISATIYVDFLNKNDETWGGTPRNSCETLPRNEPGVWKGGVGVVTGERLVGVVGRPPSLWNHLPVLAKICCFFWHNEQAQTVCKESDVSVDEEIS
uniref:Uncharacterized protein n=1 Tax=Romanomermis culicivorax TaxID=13658 RepID=A0A915K8N9_ROMCU